MSDDQHEAVILQLLIAKDEAAAAAEAFYERHWPFMTDEIAAQYQALQYLAVIMLAEFEQFTQPENSKRQR